MSRYVMLVLVTILLSIINPVDAVPMDDDMYPGVICPCECAMVLSTCDCPTAIQVKNEIAQMKVNGLSEKQVFSALQAEYGKGILLHPEKNSTMLLWMGGFSIAILFIFLGYIFSKRPKLEIIPDIKKYEQQFEEEYHAFVSELEVNKMAGK